jgi:hypothetical protein
MMAQWMKEAGFVEVEALPVKHYYRSKDAHGGVQMIGDLLRNVAPICLKLGGCEGLMTAEDAEEMIKACETELEAKPIYVNVVVTVGRRPL